MLAALLGAVVLGVGLVAALPVEMRGTSAADVEAPWNAEVALGVLRARRAQNGPASISPPWRATG